jgi:hypothetical protein
MPAAAAAASPVNSGEECDQHGENAAEQLHCFHGSSFGFLGTSVCYVFAYI